MSITIQKRTVFARINTVSRVEMKEQRKSSFPKNRRSCRVMNENNRVGQLRTKESKENKEERVTFHLGNMAFA